ncbi:MAG: thioredoxin [Deltaproteobacteria bacterium]|nr:thioredoxin [Deltaproteobacteria bacterium]
MEDKNLIQLNDTTFDAAVLQSQVPVLVDWGAEWCGPCRAIAPTVAELAGEYTGKLKVGKVNVDHNQKIAVNYRITSIPTLLLFKDGKVVSSLIGARPKSQIKEMIDKFIA